MRRYLQPQYIVLAVAALIFASAITFFLSERATAPTPSPSSSSVAAVTAGRTTTAAVAVSPSTTRAADGSATAVSGTPIARASSTTVSGTATRTAIVAGVGTASRVAGVPPGAVTATTAPLAPVATPTPRLPTPVPTLPPPPPTATPIPPTPIPAAPPLAITPLGTDTLGYGFNVFLIGNNSGVAFNNRTMGKVREAGFGWVRVQLQWQELEPSPGNYNTAPYDTIIGAAANGGANVLVSVVKSPEWASPQRPGGLPQNTQAFARTMRFLAGRYSGQVQAWEIWNEQNLAGEAGGFVEIAPYVETLKAGYTGVKAVDPGAIVLFGGLTPTGAADPTVAINDVDYLRAFYQYNGGEGRNYFDVLGAHPGSAANPPDTKYPENPGSGACPPKFASQAGNCWKNAPDFYFRRIEDQRAVMEQYGDAAKQVWLTEFGWDSCVGLPAPNGYEYCSLTDEATQAAYLARAVEIARDGWPWLGALFVWNLNYAATPNITQTDEKYAWSVLRGDWTNRPAFEALKNLPK